MYRSSQDQVFAKVLRIRARGQDLLSGAFRSGDGSGAEPGPIATEIRDQAQALQDGIELRLPLLLDRLALPPLAGDVLACLMAVEVDPFMRTLVRTLQREGGRAWVEVGTIAELLELPIERMPELAALLAASGPLRSHAIVLVDDGVAPVVATRLKLAARVTRYLLGDDHLPAWMRLCHPQPVLSRSLADPDLVQAMLRRIERALADREALVVELTGTRGVGRRFLAEGLAHALSLPLLVCDLERVERTALGERLAEARGEARLAGALLCLCNWDQHLVTPIAGGGPQEDAPPGAAPARVPAELGEFVETLSEVVVLTSEEREPLLERRAASVVHLEVPFPSPSQRGALLEEALAALGARCGEDLELSAITRRYALDPARIQVAARAAVELAGERPTASVGGDGGGTGSDVLTVGHAHVADACRRQLRHDLKSLAVRVTASHAWEDLVIPVDVYHGLREMIAYVKHGQQVYEDWGFGRRHSLSQGVSALFAGPPGTGKTMCASVMASELDMELFRVDLSRIVSKWIGETEKNLAKVFDEAQRSNAIILFDEADSLFARRTEVKSSVDRYANLEVNFLLQRIDSFGGVTILTTNFEDTIDTAFKRRLTFRLRFEKPDVDARAALWRKVFPRDCALAPDIDFQLVAQLFEMSGGNIRNAALRAAFLVAEEGRAVDMAALLVAAERESREMGVLTRTAPPPPPPPASTTSTGNSSGATPPASTAPTSERMRPLRR